MENSVQRTGKDDFEIDPLYKREQRDRLKALTIGNKDNSGNTIKKIYSRGDEYVIYDIADGDESESFRVMIDTEIESDPNGLIARFESIKEELTDFRSILHKGVHDKSIKHRAANAVSTAIRGDVDAAKKIFQRISDQVNAEYKSILLGRILYLSGGFGLVCLLSCASIGLYLLRDSEFVKYISTLREIIYAVTFAGFGGLLSISINLNSITFERELQSYSYFIYGLQRIIFSGLGGLFTFVAIKSGLALSFILKAESPLFAMLAICVVSGFSETLIPNTLRNLESKRQPEA